MENDRSKKELVVYELEKKIKKGLKHLMCHECNNKLAIVFDGLFGDEYKKIKESGIKDKLE